VTEILDHLWQSTLFAGLAALVTLLFQNQGARVRFWLWFAASVKFLVPFAALAALGGWLLPRPAAPPVMLQGFAPAAEPFVMPMAQTHVLAVPAAVPFDWSLLLLAVWGLGTFAIVLHWLSRWLRLGAVLSQAGVATSIDGVAVRIAPGPLEPGLFGIWKPVILLPQNIEDKLSPGELGAVLAHEACHMRHRDNLLAAIHMLVEALFWFHPLVWWLGARLNHERERACDEAVLAAGQAPEVYAESVLKVCKLYLHSPLACVSGVSGADLKARIEWIVIGNVPIPLGRLRKLLLAGLAAISLLAPLSVSLLIVAQSVEAQPQAIVTPKNVAELRAEQAAARKTVPFDPRNFDKFTGYYQLGPGTVATVTRDGSHFFSRLTGQINVEFFPESQTKFFTTEVHAQISFDSDASGTVTGLVLHQNGMEQHAPRISAETAKAIEDALMARIKANKPAPGTEAAVRHQIESVEKDAQDFTAMTPTLASAARDQWPVFRQMVAGLGPFKSLTFRNVGPIGADIYDVTFERGRGEWRIAPLTADGKIQNMSFRPLP
jgi:beta-lactamase regulating signal transducer with metallopeptidase domain